MWYRASMLSMIVLLSSCGGGPEEVIEHTRDERTISVTGSAEFEAEPDLATVQIDFREYFLEEYQGRDREDFKTLVGIEEVKNSVRASLEKYGVPMDSIRLRSNGVYRQWYLSKPLKQRTILFQTDDLDMVEKLLDGMDVNGVDRAYVAKREFSGQDQKRRELKVEALRQAREKAGYLLEAEGKKVGDAITIQELDESGYGWYNTRDALSNAAMPMESSPTKHEPIKMRYRVSATFSIE